jgi:hypothetical protein
LGGSARSWNAEELRQKWEPILGPQRIQEILALERRQAADEKRWELFEHPEWASDDKPRIAVEISPWDAVVLFRHHQDAAQGVYNACVANDQGLSGEDRQNMWREEQRAKVFQEILKTLAAEHGEDSPY